jgi:hypothetical protein
MHSRYALGQQPTHESRPPALQNTSSSSTVDSAPQTKVATPANSGATEEASAFSFLRGWNAGLTAEGVHNSVTGWAVVWNPAVGYEFNEILSIDVTVPIYSYRLAESLAARPKPDAELVPLRAELGDAVLSLHAQFVPEWFQYEVTGAVEAPSGDEAYGLTSGRVTFDIDNHFERTFGRVTPSLNAGGGDSSTLTNRLLTKNYTSLGPLAHFQVGVAVALLRGVTFEADAFEQLPIGDQKIYGPSKKGGATEVIGHHVTEDNGFIAAIDMPLNRHATLSSYYSRSLRQYTDTVAFGITYVLRATKSVEDVAMDELFR